jgi:hypothetical protein
VGAGPGSLRYETRFREGRFHQDQDMRFAEERHRGRAPPAQVDGWKEWTTPYPPAPGAEDPVSAMYAMRALEGDGPWTLQVFSGKKSWPLSIEPVERATIDTIFGKDTPVRVVELKDAPRGRREAARTLLRDAHRRRASDPVRAVIKTTSDRSKPDLVSYAAPTASSHTAHRSDVPVVRWLSLEVRCGDLC